MAAQDYVTPTPNLLPGTTARAADVNEKVDAINAGFEKLPAPRNDAKKGFSEPISIPAGTEPSHAATIEQLNEAVGGDYVTADELQADLDDLSSSIQQQLDDLGDAVSPLVGAIDALSTTTQSVVDAVNGLGEEVDDLRDSIDPFAKIKVISASAYTFEAEDNGKILWLTSDSPVTVTFPGAALPFENYLQGIAIQAGDGAVTFAGSGGAVIVSSGDLFSTAQKYAPVSFFRFAEAGWWLGGERA